MGYLNTSKRIKGKYRVLAHYDKETGQFIRDHEGRLEESFDDFYIPCKGGAHIYHFGYLEGNKRSVSQNTLVAYFDNYVKAQTVIEKIEAKYPHIMPTCYVDMGGKFYKEAEIFFDAKYIDEFADIMGAQTKGANLSPFSVKNLRGGPMSEGFLVISTSLLFSSRIRIVYTVPSTTSAKPKALSLRVIS